jgi:membrane dipeptidase
VTRLGPWQKPTAQGLVQRLGISHEAAELYLSSEVLDLHIESFSFHRSVGYDVRRRHRLGPFRGLLFGHADFPRLLEAGLSGGTWIISTNPLQPREERGEVFSNNLRELLGLFEEARDHFTVVRDYAEYRAARRAGKHAAFLGVQGGNAFDAGPEEIERCSRWILRVTLLHLTNSRLGVTSSPLSGGGGGLSSWGAEFVRLLNAKRIGVDLAHIDRKGFWDAVHVHDRTQPLLVTHTGVSGVHRHWRNIDDDQIRAVADTGGTVGIMYHAPFLGDRLRRGRAERIVEHLEHVRRVAGADYASLGSDWDGAIDTPRDMPTCLELPRLVDIMLRRGWTSDDVQKVLGQNFLRVVRHLRGDASASPPAAPSSL